MESISEVHASVTKPKRLRNALLITETDRWQPAK